MHDEGAKTGGVGSRDVERLHRTHTPRDLRQRCLEAMLPAARRSPLSLEHLFGSRDAASTAIAEGGEGRIQDRVR